MKKNDLKEKHELIYDEACEYLDNEFSKNICDFKDDKCGEKRNTNSCVGCCMKYKNKLLGPLTPYNNWAICEHLKDKRCLVKNLGCKLFTCDYLDSKGVKYRIKDISVLQEFNLIQKIVIKAKVQVTKEKVIKTLLFWRNRNIYLLIAILVMIVFLLVWL